MSFRSSQGRVIATVVALVFFVAILHHNADEQSFIPSFTPQHPPPTRNDPKLRERMELSEKNWERSVGLRDKMASEHPTNPQIPLFPAQSIPGFLKYPYTLWDFFPPTWTCPHDVQRVGRLGDGGKWVCGLSLYEAAPVPTPWNSEIPQGGQEGIVAYSFGINEESSFEAELLERVPAARIWGYDFSVNGWGPQIPPVHRSRTFFGKLGIGKADEPSKSPPFWTLQSLMAQNNHTYIDILKIDVEGSEYTAFDSIMDHFKKAWKGKGEALLPIGQIMIEIHVGDDRPEINFGRFRTWWEGLEGMGMRPTWMEMNLMAVTIPDHKTDPRCTEYVLVNAKDQRNLLWQQ
ncbi:hypothetical protein K458DRAFT_480527 [Lentithecium fluviatile CBS 122367]|uniref:Methyltransferase domain-containing protein n=1 Tax=Lentithecium fluviatile CBS 122367 TaxID=1168545 RepID=A0A6G1IME8_9PLEO|nr:hypothetical protein K458DRAFT_480527 [Lentithecium fluviatile CBS 122367]